MVEFGVTYQYLTWSKKLLKCQDFANLRILSKTNISSLVNQNLLPNTMFHWSLHQINFFMLVLLRRTFFLTTFYGLYFSHHYIHMLQITIFHTICLWMHRMQTLQIAMATLVCNSLLLGMPIDQINLSSHYFFESFLLISGMKLLKKV